MKNLTKMLFCGMGQVMLQNNAVTGLLLLLAMLLGYQIENTMTKPATAKPSWSEAE